MTAAPAWLEAWPEVKLPSSVPAGGLSEAVAREHERMTWHQLAELTGVSAPTLHKIAHDPAARIRRGTYDALCRHLRGGGA